MIANFMEKADAARPVIYENPKKPEASVRIVRDDKAFQGYRCEKISKVPCTYFKNGDTMILDFGTHVVGYLSFQFLPGENYPDAPLRLKLKFAETPFEMAYDFAEYKPGLSASWLQEEIITVDYPGEVKLPRRYAFRYLQVEVIATRMDVKLMDFSVRTVTSADRSELQPLPEGTDEMLVAIDKICSLTMQNCMQDVFEDGPKRDRRLWIGDFYLGQLTDPYLFKNKTISKRCLYLFAAGYKEGEYLPSCMIAQTKYFCSQRLEDYALLFCVSLCDYYESTGDRETAEELYPIAAAQISLAKTRLNENGIVEAPEGWWSFIDWCPGLEKITATQGVLIFAAEKMAKLGDEIGRKTDASMDRIFANMLRESARKHLYCPEKKAFINSYDKNQYSQISQAWMVIAGAVDGEAGRQVMRQCLSSEEVIRPNTAFAHHFMVDALVRLGMMEEALAYIKMCWGSLVKNGADTCWEVNKLEDPFFTPYTDCVINSSCHIWGSTPSYFIRKYAKEFEEISQK